MMGLTSMRKRKGQAAMDFIFTYGWALLGVMVVLGALVYFGVGSTDQLIPDQCTFLSGLNCIDMQVADSDNDTYPSAVIFVIRNELGFDISNISIWINGTCDSQMNMTGEVAPTSLLNKESGTYGFLCQNLTGIDVSEKISFQFTNTDTGNNHRKVGYIDLSQ